jgi:hypothetical protein
VTLRARLERLGLVAPPAPNLRSYRLQSPGEQQGRTRPFGPIVTAAEWGDDLELWGGNKLTVTVDGFDVYVQLSRTQPPNPPVWDAPFPLGLGPYSHVGPFGYFRFKDRIPGSHGTVEGAAFSE